VKKIDMCCFLSDIVAITDTA